MLIKIIMILSIMANYTWDFDFMLKNPSILEFHILNDKENLNTVDKNGRTILNMMIKNNKALKDIEFLLKNGGDANLKDGDGNFPLTYAILNKNKKQIILLLQYGAFLELKDSKNISLKESLKLSKLKINLKNIKNKLEYKYSLYKNKFFLKQISEGELNLLKLYENELKYYISYHNNLFFYLYLRTATITKGNKVLPYLLKLYNKKLDCSKLYRVFNNIAFFIDLESLNTLLKYKVNFNVLKNNKTILDNIYHVYDKFKIQRGRQVKERAKIINLLRKNGAKRACEILQVKCP